MVFLRMDMMKFAYFIAHRGLVLGEQLLSPSYIDMAVSALIAVGVTLGSGVSATLTVKKIS